MAIEIMGEASRLAVKFSNTGRRGTPEGEAQWGALDQFCGTKMWRVGLLHGENRFSAIPMSFARKQDAIAAANAILPLIDWSLGFREVSARVRAYGAGRIRTAMVEAMSW